MPKSLDVALELEEVLSSEQGEDRKKSLTLLTDLVLLLRARGHEESPPTDYTLTRSSELRRVGLSLLSGLSSSSLASASYSTKAGILSVTSDSYLKLVHAFKTDTEMWSRAQDNLVPMLLSVASEADIDAALLVLESHLNDYLKSLDSWSER